MTADMDCIACEGVPCQNTDPSIIVCDSVERGKIERNTDIL